MNKTYECGNCDWFGDKVEPIEDLNLRLEPGDVVPEDECPECGSFCHPLNVLERFIDELMSPPTALLERGPDKKRVRVYHVRKYDGDPTSIVREYWFAVEDENDEDENDEGDDFDVRDHGWDGGDIFEFLRDAVKAGRLTNEGWTG